MQQHPDVYRNLFDNALSGQSLHRIILDEHGVPIDYTFLAVNKAFETMTGLKAEDTVGKHATEVVPGLKDTGLIDVYGRVALTGEPARFDTFVPFLNRHYDIYAFSHGPGEFSVTFFDITERKRQEWALLQSDLLFRKLNEALPAGVMLFSAEKEVLWANRAACQWVGVDAPGQDWRKWIAAAGRVINERGVVVDLDRALARTIDNCQQLRERVIGMHSEDPARLLWLLVNTEPNTDPETGRCRQMLVAFQDITERKRSATLVMDIIQALSTATGDEFLHRLAIHLASTLGADFALVGELDAGQQMVQCTVFLPDGQLLHDLTYALGGTPCERVFETGSYSCASGVSDRFPLDTYLSEIGVEAYAGAALSTAAGEHRGLIAVMWKRPLEHLGLADSLLRAFAARGAAELERQRAEERLRATVDELAAARHRAEVASQAKSELLSTVSHEIRTPLNAILGLTELLAESSLDESQRGDVRIIRRAAEVLHRLISDMLDVARIEAGRINIRYVAFNLPTLLSESVELFRTEARNKGLTLECRIDQDLPAAVRGDPGRLEQVLLNLIGNAIKFTDQGSVSLHASAHATSDAIALRCEVVDTGIGVPPQVAGRLFSPFVQADASTTRRFGGTGLGLAICRGLVEAMGGKIGFQSKPGAGSRFWFEVLLHPAQHVPLERPALPPVVRLAGTVLIAEDNLINQKVVARLLERIGCQVRVVPTGRAAIEALESGRFDAVLMDCQMPEMDGLEATRWIRANQSEVRTPIIALTANAAGDERERCLAAGMDDYIAKPVTLAALAATLQRWLPGR